MVHPVLARILAAVWLVSSFAGCAGDDHPAPRPQTADEKATAALVGTWLLRIDQDLIGAHTKAYQEKYGSWRGNAIPTLGSLYAPRVVRFTLREDGTFTWRGWLEFDDSAQELGPGDGEPEQGTGWWRYCPPGLVALVYDYTRPDLAGTEPRWSVHTDMANMQGDTLMIWADYGIEYIYERRK